jgi:hypothetical protein
MNNEWGELAFWGVLFLMGMMAFQWWANHPPRPSMNWEDAQTHASYRNKDITFSDYEAQPFALDPKDAV